MASRAQSKVKMLERNGKKDKLSTIENLNFKFNYYPYNSKENLLNIKGLNFYYEKENYLIKDLSFSIKKTDKGEVSVYVKEWIMLTKSLYCHLILVKLCDFEKTRQY